MKLAEIRRSFLDFFAGKGHEEVESSSLVPHNDPSLLFTNAGMNQFKDLFLGREKRSYSRATSCQKCVRAGGKHNDLENVGFTARHHTFFEMLGNFSFGDYFKEEAISYAWEFITEHLKLPQDKLYITVFEDDDEAAKIWEDKIGIPKDKIYRFGEKDNFWSMGDVGPCGPCSEVFIDRGEKYSCGSECAMGCECDRFMEFWNLVFMQFDRNKQGELSPLPRPSVDTGMGLERVASILQETETNYEVDAFLTILEHVGDIAGKKYDPKSKEAFNYRVIGDHARASTFLIADGVMPSNEGRGYVLRRIIRRAVRYGRNIGFEGPFINQVCSFVIDQMSDAYPELKDKKAFIIKAVTAEEEQFFKTLERGLSLLDEELEALQDKKVLSGDVAFKLYDTFGFPVDLTRIICQERDVQVDEEAFAAAMKRQKDQSRQNWKGAGGEAIDDSYHKVIEMMSESGISQSFVGYDSLSSQGTCKFILSSHNQIREFVDSYDGSEIVDVIFDKTPFYGEGGGQAGDKGSITADGFRAEVIDTLKPLDGLIVARVKVLEGVLRVGADYRQVTDAHRRRLTERNHTATHMLHWALRDTLGDHVKQAGSLVNDELLRFDFSHFQGLTDEEIETVERKINERIWSHVPVTKAEMGKEEAVAAGAIAFFGEKYGDKVRVVKVGEFSTELCGGTHVQSSSEINIFKIISEASVASGVRRIVAYTSEKAFEFLSSQDKLARNVKSSLKVQTAEEILSKFDKLQQNEKELQKSLDSFRSQQVVAEIKQSLDQAIDLGGVKLLSYLVPEDSSGVKTLRDIAEKMKAEHSDLILLLGMKQKEAGKALLLAAKGKSVPKSFKSGDLIKNLSPLISGRGGGKPDMAQAGGTDLDGVEKALAAVEEHVNTLLGK